MPSSIFANLRQKAWPYRYAVQITIRTIAGGVPSDPNVAEGWLRSKLGDPDEQIRDLVAQTMAERGLTADEAAAEVSKRKHLNGFKRDENGLYIEGRQAKAMLKEAANVAVASGKLKNRGWGTTNKGLLSFLAEHVFVPEERIYIQLRGDGDDENGPLVHVKEPTGVNQKFVHTYRGAGIQYEEFVERAILEFVVMTDWDFSNEEWAMIWLTGEQQGLGASRSQGFGRFEITNWELLD